MSRATGRFIMELEVTDAEALWFAAVKYLQARDPGIAVSEITDTIGSRVDPDISGCLILLLEPDDKPPGVEVQQSSWEDDGSEEEGL